MDDRVKLVFSKIDLLKSLEACRLKPYNDQTGRPILEWVKGATIGWGHLIPVEDWNAFKDGITQIVADELLLVDLVPVMELVNNSLKVSLLQNQFDALVIFSYNIGPTAFKTSSALTMINDPVAKTFYPDLESAWKAWNKSQGKINNGLIYRRNVEWDLYKSAV